MGDRVTINQRQSNMDLLRILAMLGVIALHYNGLEEYGGFALSQSTVNMTLLGLNECLWAWPVNAFIMLSGYFLYRRERIDIKKPVMLFVQLVVFQMLAYALEVFMGQRKFKITALLFCVMPENYFVVLYIVLYLFSPFINRLFNSLDRRGKLLLGTMLFAVFSVWAYSVELLELLLNRGLNQSSPVAFGGDSGGYTIVNFAMCYFIGALLGEGSLSIRRPAAVFAAATAANCVICQIFGPYFAAAYSSPLVIIQAAALLSVFSKLDIPWSGTITKLSGASFTVFLAHLILLRFCRIGQFVNSSPIIMLAHIALCQIGLYIVSYVIHVIYTAVTKPIYTNLWKRVKPFEISAESIIS